MKRIYCLLLKYWDILSYLFFGALTTAVNFCVYFPLYNLIRLPAAVSNIFAWIAAVIFAFFTNKLFVFRSRDWSFQTLIPESVKFVSCRIGSGLFETGSIWLFVDLLSLNGNWIKVIVSVLVVVLNYFASKWFVFKKKKD